MGKTDVQKVFHADGRCEWSSGQRHMDPPGRAGPVSRGDDIRFPARIADLNQPMNAAIALFGAEAGG
jgi:hypothetical protein